jgi:hypothetical protein
MFNSVTWRPRTEFHPNRTATEESAVINLFTPINKMWLLLSRFSRNSQMFNSVMWRSRTEFHRNRTATEESAVINLFTPINKMWLLISRFSRNSQMFNSFMWRPLTEFYSYRTVTEESAVINLLTPIKNVAFTEPIFTKLPNVQQRYVKTSYQILPKSDSKWGKCRYKFTYAHKKCGFYWACFHETPCYRAA